VTLWDWTMTMLLVVLEFAVVAVLVAPHWVARKLRALLNRLLEPLVRPLANLRAGNQNVQTSREAR
jgi:uncharacterized protein YggT (Ycf19 family)